MIDAELEGALQIAETGFIPSDPVACSKVMQYLATTLRTLLASRAWQPIESAPKSTPILVHYKNPAGMGRTVKAEYIEKFTVESDDTDDGEYSEELDNYFIPEGWHEIVDNHPEWGYFPLDAGNNPTHWQPLPTPPDLKEGA